MPNVVIDKADLGSTYGSANSTTVNLVTTQAVASGGFIVLIGGWFGDTTQSVSITTTGGLAWTIDKQSVGAAGSNSVWIASAQAPSGLASGTTLTATMTASVGARFIAGLSFTNVATSSPVDGTPLGPTNVASTAAWSSGSYSIAAGSVIVAACFAEGASANNSPTAPSIEGPENDNAPDTISIVAEYRIEASASAYTVSGTWSAPANTTNIAVAYKAAAGGAAQVPYQPQYQMAPIMAQ